MLAAMRRFLVFILCFAISTVACSSHSGEELDLRQRVKKITLDNGMKILMLKRDGAPVFFGELSVRVGSIEEGNGPTGLAHFFEHMAFKGTDKIGSKDFVTEKPLLEQVLAVGTRIADMKRQGATPDEYKDLLAQRLVLEAKENTVTEKNAFYNALIRSGANDLNAATGVDNTVYYAELPSSKLELWAYMESERLMHRVFRGFFTEVDVVNEERRMTIDNSPDGRLYEAYLGAGFVSNPYRVPTIGSARDIQTITPEEARAFYSKFYIPSRMVVAIVGNFDMDVAERILRQYFSRIPEAPEVVENFPDETFTGPPRSVTITDDSPPQFYLGYHRPAFPHPDVVALEVVENILCEGETARLYKRLVLADKSADSIQCASTFPGDRLPSLFTFMVLPMQGHSNKELVAVIADELKKLGEEGPTANELQIVKNNIDADFIYSLDSNSGLAESLAYHETIAGRWDYMYDFQDAVHKVTAADVERVIHTYFTPSRQVAAYLETKVEGKK